MTKPYLHKLNELIAKEKIKDWKLIDVDENGEEGKTSQFCNSQRLKLFFDDDITLTVDAWCSGSSENITFSVS